MSIKTERDGNTLMLRVRSRINWLALIAVPLLLAMMWGIGIEPAWEGLTDGLRTGRSIGGYVLGLPVASAIFLFLLYVLLLELFGAELIVITPADLEIQSLVFGVIRSRRSIPNSTVEKLRYEEWPGPYRDGTDNGLRFECVGETVTFALNAPTEDCHDILDKMLQVYKFPIPDPPEEKLAPGVVRW
jgi:hypothetical protein